MVQKLRRAAWSIVVVTPLLNGLGCAPQPAGTTKQNDFITVSPPVQRSSDGTLTGSEILLQSEKAYSQLQSYSGTIHIAYTASYGAGSFSGTTDLKVFFRRPDCIRIEGKDSNGDPFVIAANGRVMWDRWGGSQGGVVKQSADIQAPLLEYSGVSSHGSLLLPSCLLQLQWGAQMLFLPRGRLLTAFATDARLAGTEVIDSTECYRVVCERRLATWTLYVGVEDFLIRRIEDAASEEQTRFQRLHGGGGFTGKITSAHSSHTFEIRELNGDLDNALFDPPLGTLK